MKSARRRAMVAVILSALAGPLVCRAQSDAGKTQEPTASAVANTEPEVASASSPSPQATTAPQDQGASTSANAPQSQTPAQAPAAPQPLPTPSMSGPLTSALPHEFDAGPFGKLEVNGIVSGIGVTEGNHVIAAPPFMSDSTYWDVSNGQVFLQKTTGWWQFYFQAGAYNIPALGVPYLSTGNAVNMLYTPLPVGYVKFVKGNFNIEVGALPTLVGAEYTFTFENMNIERGLLWNQENAVNRGIQLNDTYKKLTLSFSWNDGFYSNRYTWLSGSLTYAFNASNSLAFVGAGNAGEYDKNTVATPLFLNNEQIYNVIYTYTHGNWVIQPYFQYSNVPTDARIGIPRGASTQGEALLLSYNLKHGLFLAVRPEYISSTGTVAKGNANLLYGPGSNAFGFTVTPTYQKGAFFGRAEFSIVHAGSSTAGDAFGSSGLDANQPRGAIEVGFLF
jgi:Putative beta-barrel porin-2, OmpL-like. bbp2